MKNLKDYILEAKADIKTDIVVHPMKYRDKKMKAYNDEKFTFLDAIENDDDAEVIADFLKNYDSTGAMGDALEDCSEDDVLVAAKHKDGETYVFTYGPDGIEFE